MKAPIMPRGQSSVHKYLALGRLTRTPYRTWDDPADYFLSLKCHLGVSVGHVYQRAYAAAMGTAHISITSRIATGRC